MNRLTRYLLASFLLTAFSIGHAHLPDMTYTKVHASMLGLMVEYTTPASSFDEQPQAPEHYSALVQETVYITQNEIPCPLSEASEHKVNGIDSYQYRQLFKCPENQANATLHYKRRNDDESHENFTEILIGQYQNKTTLSFQKTQYGLPVGDVLHGTTAGLPDKTLALDLGSPGFIGYIQLGIEHILIGIDHILFVIALLLVSMRVKHVALLITSFTLGHSITLGLSTLNIFSVPAQIAESLIAFSIIYVVIENLIILSRSNTVQSVSHRYWVTGLFGLVHGFGFGFVLQEIGLPDNSLISALLAFNIGVELGQLAILSLVLPLLHVIWRKLSYIGFSAISSSTIGLFGTIWLIERVFFW